MFGKPCYKINGKAFVCFFENCMVFKLKGDAHIDALDMKDAKLFDPSGKGRNGYRPPGEDEFHERCKDYNDQYLYRESHSDFWGLSWVV